MRERELDDSVSELGLLGQGDLMTNRLDGSFGKAVEDYIRRGPIIRVGCGDKRPLIRWEEFQHRRPSVPEVQAWLSCWREAGIGIVTGSISGIVMLDIDPRHGGDTSLKSLERQHNPMPMTGECRSGGGGRHLYFAHPGGVVRNKVGLAAGADLRGDAGYVVAPPSIHASGSLRLERGPRAGRHEFGSATSLVGPVDDGGRSGGWGVRLVTGVDWFVLVSSEASRTIL